MKAVILAGGLGTRLAEETETRPKPMVEIGGHPILRHIMNHYGKHGIEEFVLALGYKGEVIKRYFLDATQIGGDLTIDLARGQIVHRTHVSEPWTVHLKDTGLHTLTGGRLKRLAPLLRDGRFMVTYGDGVSNVDIDRLMAFHAAQGRLATVTAVRPPARYGEIIFDGDLVKRFTEKPQTGEGWINGGFFVFEPGVLDEIGGDDESLEVNTLERLAARGQLAAYRHEGFWQCMDTLRDKRFLESLWQGGQAPWR